MEEEEASNEGLIQGIDFNYHNPCSASSLSAAVRAGSLDLVKKFISFGRNPNIPDNRGWTSLHEAAIDEKKTEILSYLLDNGAYIEHKTFEGETPLFLACEKKNLVGFEKLLEAGASVNSETLSGLTPLHVACKSSSHPGILMRLLSAGADPFKKEYFESRTPLHIAIIEKNVKTILILIEETRGKILELEEIVLLQYAIREGNVSVLKAIVNNMPNGEEIARTCSVDQGWTCLMEAVQARDPESVGYLLGLGADVSQVDSRGVSALHVAANSPDPRCFCLLLKGSPPASLAALLLPPPPPLPPPPCSRPVSPPLIPPSILVLLMASANLSSLSSLLSDPHLPPPTALLASAPHLDPSPSPRITLSHPAFLFYRCFDVEPLAKLEFLKLLLKKKVPLDLDPNITDRYTSVGLRYMPFIEAVLEGHKGGCRTNDRVNAACRCTEYLSIALSPPASTTLWPSPDNHRLASLLVDSLSPKITRLFLANKHITCLSPDDIASEFVERVVGEGSDLRDNRPEEIEFFQFLLKQVSSFVALGSLLQRGGPWVPLDVLAVPVPSLRRLSRGAASHSPLTASTTLPVSLADYLEFKADSPRPSTTE